MLPLPPVRHRPGRSKGYTLVELLVVIFIILIIILIVCIAGNKIWHAVDALRKH